MEIQEYLDNLKELYTLLIEYLESEDDFSQEELDFFKIIQKQQFAKNYNDFKLFLRLISHISLNHYRTEIFLDKINKIIILLKEDIKKTFSNSETFAIFQFNKLILYFLFCNEIISIDEQVKNIILSDETFSYKYYFYPEIEKHIDDKTRTELKESLLAMDPNIFTNFDKKRKEGENDSYICSLIRTDSIEDFIIYINKNNISLTSEINTSIFETNLCFIQKSPTIIEYSAFYGSIQIFQYLRMSNLFISSTIWSNVIHSKNAQLIHLLEDDHILPVVSWQNYQSCIEESIKCHHNDIATYFINNFFNEYKTNFQNDFDNNILNFGYHYFNFNFIPSEKRHYYTIFYACKYGYTKFVELFLMKKKTIYRTKLILKKKIIF